MTVDPWTPSDPWDVSYFVHRHEHEWECIAAEFFSIGWWYPLFRCMVCGDVATGRLPVRKVLCGVEHPSRGFCTYKATHKSNRHYDSNKRRMWRSP